jgi:DNA polymerase
VVNGHGKAHEADFLIVGEAPGREEDAGGLPFIGGAGRVLNALLAEANILRTDCYVTNVCRCKPPNNRVPDLDEIFACQSHLRKEILSVNPKLVVALGDTACTLLTGRRLTDYRGSLLSGIGPAAGYRVLATYHPSFVMRAREMFPVVAWDLKKARQPYPDYEVNYLINPSREQLIAWCDHWQGSTCAVDIETRGDKEENNKDDALNPWKGEIIGIAFCPKPGVACSLSHGSMVANWDIIQPFMASCECVWANNLFDRTYLAVHKGFIANSYWDVQDAMHLIYPALPKKLDFLRSLYTNMEPYKQQYKNSKGHYKPGELEDYDLGTLNCKDVDATLRTMLGQKAYLSEQLRQDMEEENELALKMRLRGVSIDTTAVATHYAQLLPRIEGLRQSFAQTYSVDISSPKQLARLLYDDLKLPVFDDRGKSSYPGGPRSTNEKAIQALGNSLGLVYLNDDDGERFEGSHQHAGALAAILEFRGLQKLSSTYCEGVYRAVESDGRLHAQWSPTGTDTGRWSCRGTPLQGVPKDMRDIVVAKPGHILFGADYKGMQIIAAGVLAEDWELVENMLKPEYSIHDEVLEAIKPLYPSIKRIQAKTVVFGTFFGRSARDIAHQFHVPVKTAQLWQDIFYSKRPKLRELFEERLPKEWETHGYVTTIDNRKKYCERVTEAKNTPVQNFESVVTKAAMRKLEAEGYQDTMMIHDGIVCEEPIGPTNEARF